MKKSIWPIVLIAGAAVVLMAMKKKPRVTVTAESPIKQSEAEFEAEYQTVPTVKPAQTLAQKALTTVKTLFPKKTAAQKAAQKASKIAIKRAKKAGIKKKPAQAVTKFLKKGINIGFSDDNVLV